MISEDVIVGKRSAFPTPPDSPVSLKKVSFGENHYLAFHSNIPVAHLRRQIYTIIPSPLNWSMKENTKVLTDPCVLLRDVPHCRLISIVGQRIDDELDADDFNPSLLKGKIAVANLEFEKLIAVRYSIDNWDSFSEVSAKCVSSLPNKVDLFDFWVSAGNAQTLEVAIRYELRRAIYWDNNGGANYCCRLVKNSA